MKTALILFAIGFIMGAGVVAFFYLWDAISDDVHPVEEGEGKWEKGKWIPRPPGGWPAPPGMRPPGEGG